MRTRRQKLRRGLIIGLFLLLPVTLNYYSPYLMTSGTAERVASFSLVLWLAMLASAPLLGRAFCGWACPFHGLQLIVEQVDARPTRMVRFTRWIKYVFWAAWAGGVAAIAVSTGGWTSFQPLYYTENYVSFDRPEALVIYYGLVGLVLVGLAWGKRGFCHYLCPFGVWNIVGEKLGHALRIPRLMLRADSSACTNCGTCSRVCPMSLPVTEMVAKERMRHTECILCGSCVDGCSEGGVRYAFGRAR